MSVIDKARTAKAVSKKLAAVSGKTKNAALKAIAKALEERRSEIISANKSDLENAKKTDLAKPLLKRLKFDEKKIEASVTGIKSLIKLADPVGSTLSALKLDKGLELFRVTCPIGVIGIVFESRPDALVQISTLCLKSSNAVILKGGSEAANTNRILAEIISEASQKAGMPKGWLTLLETRQDVSDMLEADDYIDLIIPRGSNDFVRMIMSNTNIPVLGHADGVCHVYVDEQADVKTAVSIAVDSKCQYPAVCNAAETLLVHSKIAKKFLPRVKKGLDKHEVRIRGCEKTREIIECKPADEEDWKTEYLDYILSIKVVDSFDEAVGHINTYGSGHTDCIVTENAENAALFLDAVDSADVFWNCSTRFSDGYRFGLGAEVGISTNKIHARGPVGLEGLLIYKWKLIGTGQTVAPYADGRKQFAHKKIKKDFAIYPSG